MCAIKAVSDWITSAPLLQPPYITTFLRRCRVQIPLSLTMSLFTGNLRRSAGAGESFARRTQFFERGTTVIRSRIYPHGDASPVDTPFEHAYVYIFGWLCASANP